MDSEEIIIHSLEDAQEDIKGMKESYIVEIRDKSGIINKNAMGCTCCGYPSAHWKCEDVKT